MYSVFKDNEVIISHLIALSYIKNTVLQSHRRQQVHFLVKVALP